VTVAFGYTLSSEEHSPTTLVELGVEAEARGFDFVSMSDHYHPWTQTQGHSPFVWSALGALAQATDMIELAVGVTCPIMRIHPVVLAQATATTALLARNRFVFGVGTGEALNEHITAQRWPRVETRLDMLDEAVGVIRRLWTGDTVDFDGRYFQVDNARLFDPPDSPPPVIVSGFGPAATELAGRIGDGYWGHEPDPEVIATYRDAGGDGPRYAQIRVCWAADADTARRTVHERWPNGGLSGQLSQDLPTWTHFEQAAANVTVEQASEHVPCGPDPEPVVAVVDEFVSAGYDHLYFHQVGPDQRGFFEFWTATLQPALAAAAHRSGGSS